MTTTPKTAQNTVGQTAIVCYSQLKAKLTTLKYAIFTIAKPDNKLSGDGNKYLKLTEGQKHLKIDDAQRELSKHRPTKALSDLIIVQHL